MLSNNAKKHNSFPSRLMSSASAISKVKFIHSPSNILGLLHEFVSNDWHEL